MVKLSSQLSSVDGTLNSLFTLLFCQIFLIPNIFSCLSLHFHQLKTVADHLVSKCVQWGGCFVDKYFKNWKQKWLWNHEMWSTRITPVLSKTETYKPLTVFPQSGFFKLYILNTSQSTYTQKPELSNFQLFNLSCSIQYFSAF